MHFTMFICKVEFVAGNLQKRTVCVERVTEFRSATSRAPEGDKPSHLHPHGFKIKKEAGTAKEN